MHSNTEIKLATCEDLANNNQGFSLKQIGSETLEVFPINDPFGIGKAIVPVLLMGADQVVRGMGTAFHFDGWGTFITADHVIHWKHPDFSHKAIKSKSSSEFAPILLLSPGLIFGTVGLPEEAIINVREVATPLYETNDPMGALRGEDTCSALDLAILRSPRPIPSLMNRTLPIRFKGRSPQKGDLVVAVGFPELDCTPVTEEAIRYQIRSGMHAAYGRIIDIHREGRGSKTPVIEVEANWPSGMSGGPVFNSHGEVIGIVSRSLEPSGDSPGNGSAVSFESLEYLEGWLPSLDGLNPGWRKGWVAIRDEEFNISNFFRTKEEADLAAYNLGNEYDVYHCAQRIGLEEYVLNP